MATPTVAEVYQLTTPDAQVADSEIFTPLQIVVLFTLKFVGILGFTLIMTVVVEIAEQPLLLTVNV